MVEIARGINGNAKLIILDEPTSSLSQAENEKLFAIIRKLKAKGISFLFISHRLEEILEISDRVIVLKDGKKVAELDAKSTNPDEIIKNMVGRNYDDYYNRQRTFEGEEILRLEHITSEPVTQGSAYTPTDISFSLHEGRSPWHRRVGGRRAYRADPNHFRRYEKAGGKHFYPWKRSGDP